MAGGSANAYDYVYQDPINKFDLDGRCWGWCPHIHWKHMFHSVGHFISDHREGIMAGVGIGVCAFTAGAGCIVAGALSVGGSAVFRAQRDFGHGRRRWGDFITGTVTDVALTGMSFGIGRLAERAGIEFASTAGRIYRAHDAGWGAAWSVPAWQHHWGREE